MSDAPQIVEISPADPSVNPMSDGLPPEVAPEVEETKPKSIDDALKDAFRKGKEAQDAKAEAKVEPKAEKVEPKEEATPEPAKAEKPRAEDGKFQSREPKPEPKPTAFKDAPGGFDDAAKKEWEAVPESVRGAIHRRTRELESGIEKYRADATEYEQVRKFSDMAKQSGTTLSAAVKSYVDMEQMLRANPIVGLEQIVQNMGLKGQNGQPLTFRQVAEAYLRRTPEQAQNATLQARLTMMERQQKEDRANQQRMQQAADQERMISTARSQFPRFDDLRPVMLGLVQSGAISGSSNDEIMRNAYEEAARRFPDAAHTGSPALAQNQHPAQRGVNPAGQKSITGSPSAGATPSGKPKKAPSIDEALANAIRRAS